MVQWKLNYTNEVLAGIDHKAIELLQEIREKYENEELNVVISGCIGPRGDGYDVGKKMTVNEAVKYHITQIKNFSETEADIVSAFTMTYAYSGDFKHPFRNLLNSHSVFC